eukprot:381988_1
MSPSFGARITGRLSPSLKRISPKLTPSFMTISRKNQLEQHVNLNQFAAIHSNSNRSGETDKSKVVVTVQRYESEPLDEICDNDSSSVPIYMRQSTSALRVKSISKDIYDHDAEEK